MKTSSTEESFVHHNIGAFSRTHKVPAPRSVCRYLSILSQRRLEFRWLGILINANRTDSFAVQPTGHDTISQPAV
jgi:hypothetical protein